jgi:hypothetical protein
MLKATSGSPLHRSVPFAFAFVTGPFAGWAPRLGCVDLGPVPAFTGILDGRRALEGLGVPRPAAALGALAAPLALRWEPCREPRGIAIRCLGGAGALARESAIRDWRAGAVWVSCGPGHLAWRYDACPDADYTVLGAYTGDRLVGFAVFRTEAERGRAYLNELAAVDGRSDVLNCLLAESLRRMAADGVGIVTASFPVASAQGQLLAARGFGLWATPLWGMRLAAFPYSVGAGHPVSSRESWFFSLGDWLTH